MNITLDQLRAICKTRAGREACAKYLPHINAFSTRYKLTTPLRLAHFLAQCAHESADFRHVVETANPVYFNRYEGSKVLGNTRKGDGIRFKGRGLLQLTGRDNYTRFGRAEGIDFAASPDLLEMPTWAVKSAMWYFSTKPGLLAAADRDDTAEVAHLIQGSSDPAKNGLASREAYTARAKKALGL